MFLIYAIGEEPIFHVGGNPTDRSHAYVFSKRPLLTTTITTQN